MLSTRLKITILTNPTHIIKSLDYMSLLGLLSDLKTLNEFDLFTFLYTPSRAVYVSLNRDLINFEACEKMIIEVRVN